MGSTSRQWCYGGMDLIPSTLNGEDEGDRVHVMSREGARQGSLERRLFGEARPRDCVETRPSLWHRKSMVKFTAIPLQDSQNTPGRE